MKKENGIITIEENVLLNLLDDSGLDIEDDDVVDFYLLDFSDAASHINYILRHLEDHIDGINSCIRIVKFYLGDDDYELNIIDYQGDTLIVIESQPNIDFKSINSFKDALEDWLNYNNPSYESKRIK